MGGYHWLVKHRYSEFHEMHEQVCPHLMFIIYDSMVNPGIINVCLYAVLDYRFNRYVNGFSLFY